MKCPVCSKNHSYDQCSFKTENSENRRAVCPNCNGDHPASYKGCKKYYEAREIIKIQTTEKISYADAVKAIKDKQKRIIAQAELPYPGIGSKEQIAEEDNHATNTTRNNTNSDDKISNADPSACNGNTNPGNPSEVNHKQCINVDILITFVQSIGTVLHTKNTTDDSIKNINELVEQFVAKIKNHIQMNL